MDFKKEREDKLNLYLITLWNEVHGCITKGATNSVIADIIGWTYPEVDAISRYAFDMGCTEVIRSSDEVFFTRAGAKKLRHIKHEPRPPSKVKPELVKIRVELDNTKAELDNTKAELDKIKELEAKEKQIGLVELDDIGEADDTSLVSTAVSWVKGMFFK